MKNRFQKSISFCLALVILAANCNGCSTTNQKSTQPTIQSTVVNTENNAGENISAEKPGAAETPAQKAIKKYEELLKTYPTILHENAEVLGDLSFGYDENMAAFGEHYDYFTVFDLDNDGIPELIASTVINKGWVPVSVFRYNESENELQLLKDPLDPESHATFEHMSTAGGLYCLYICRENHLHSNWGGDTPVGFQEENHAYVLGKEGLAVVDCAVSNNTGDSSDIAVDFGDVLRMNDETTRKAVFDSLM